MSVWCFITRQKRDDWIKYARQCVILFVTLHELTFMSTIIMSSVFLPSLEHTNARYRPDRVEVATEKTLFSGTRKFGIGPRLLSRFAWLADWDLFCRFYSLWGKAASQNYLSLGVERHCHTTDDCHGLSLSVPTVIQDWSSYHITYHAVQDLVILEKVINRGWVLSRDFFLWSRYRKDKIADGVNYAVFKQSFVQHFFF
jgi:hypothetical protein